MLGTRDEIVARIVKRANQFGRAFRADELCWCGLPLDKHIELGCTSMLATTHGAELPPPRAVSEWDPWSIPSHWMAF